jgi:hypothetical protein
MNVPRFAPELAIELSDEEILEDLCWPHPPPGRWGLDASRPDRAADAHPVDSNGWPRIRMSVIRTA